MGRRPLGAVDGQSAPLLTGAPVRFECLPHARYEGGDPVIVMGRLTRVICQDGAPLVFAGGQVGRFVVA
jgi:flavin reductase (DIM6/NTAB) family NADH-FMN oxidoreductase RutF